MYDRATFRRTGKDYEFVVSLEGGREGRGGEGRGGEKTNIERELQKLLAKATYFVNTEVTRKRRACASHKTGIRKRGTDLIGRRKRPFPKLPALVSPPGGYAGT